MIHPYQSARKRGRGADLEAAVRIRKKAPSFVPGLPFPAPGARAGLRIAGAMLEVGIFRPCLMRVRRYKL